MSTPKRPVLRYHGGKWMLAPWIIEHFAQHRVYVEPFGGAASVLMQKARSYAEVYNDLDGETVNLFRVLRDPAQARELERVLKLTPFARTEFEQSYLTAGDPIEQARRTMFRSFAGFGSGAATGHQTGFRSNSNRSGTTPAHDWRNFAEILPEFVERLRGVVIENKAAAAVMQQHDTPETLHYCDPPYPLSTRTLRWHYNSLYRFEMTDEQHRDLADCLHSLKGMVVLSGYPSPLYDEQLFSDWKRIERAAFADGAEPRTEVLWLNSAAAKRLEAETQQLRLIA